MVMTPGAECGVDPLGGDEKLVEEFKYYCEGILVSIVGCIGRFIHLVYTDR